MPEIYQYGFILFCPMTEDGTGYIGNHHIFDTTDSQNRAQGSVRFKASNLPIGFNPNKIYLVRYTLAGRMNSKWVDKLLVVQQFNKADYEGELAVDVGGNVKWRKLDSEEWVELSLTAVKSESEKDTVEPNSTPFDANSIGMDDIAAALNLPVEIRDLPKDVFKQNEYTVASFTIPYDRFDYDVSDNKYGMGIVSFYNRSMATFIRDSYLNNKYSVGNKKKDVAVFLSRDTEIDNRAVHGINTGQNIYLVKYETSGMKVQHPQNFSIQIDGTSHVIFLMSLPHKRVVSVSMMRDGININMILDSWDRLSEGVVDIEDILKAGPVEGQTTENFLNVMTSKCIQCNAVVEGLKCLEEYRDKITNLTYCNVKLRLLQRAYAENIGETKVRYCDEIIECLDVLIASTNKLNTKLAYTMEKADKLRETGRIEQSSDNYEIWLRMYGEYIKENPEARDKIRNQYDRAVKMLQQGDEEITSSYQLDEYDNSFGQIDIELDEYIQEKIEKVSCGKQLGEEMARYDTLEAFQIDEEEAERIISFLREKEENCEPDDYWALAKIYSKLPDTIMDDVLSNQMKETFSKAFLEDARRIIKRGEEKVQNDWNSMCALYYCSMALNYVIDKTYVIAAAGTMCLGSDEFDMALCNRISLMDILKIASQKKKLQFLAKGMVELCYRNMDVKEILISQLDCMNPVDKRLVAGLVKELRKLSNQMIIDEQDQYDVYGALTDAVTMFVNFYEEFRSHTGSLRTGDDISFMAKNLLKDTNESFNTAWFTNETIKLTAIKALLEKIVEYGTIEGFHKRSEKLSDCINSVMQMINVIVGNGTNPFLPSIITYTLVLPFLRQVNNKLLNMRQQLCSTTMPVLKIDQITEWRFEEDVLELTVPVINLDKDTQTAENVVLTIYEDREVFACERSEYHVSDNIVGGESVNVQIRIKLHNRENRSVSLNMRLGYTYICGVDIHEERRGNRNRRNARTFYTGTDKKQNTFYPGKNEWFEMDIALDQTQEKRVIKSTRIKSFDGRGKVNTTNEPILRNRDEQVKEVIETLTIDDFDFDNKEPMELLDYGQWVIIQGQWRVGKTVILNRIKKELSDSQVFPRTIVVMIDLLSCVCEDKEKGEVFEDRVATKILQELLRQIDKYVGNFEADDEEYFFMTCFEKLAKSSRYNINLDYIDITWDRLKLFLTEYIEKLREEIPEASIVLLVDEFTSIYSQILKGFASKGFPGNWLYFIDETNILCVVAGGEHTETIMTTYAGNHYQKASKIVIQYLKYADVVTYLKYVLWDTEKDAREYMCKKLEIDPENADSITPEQLDMYPYYIRNNDSSTKAIEKIYNLTKGSAFLLMRFCTEMIKLINEPESGIRMLTTNVVDRTIDRIVNNAKTQDAIEGDYFYSLYNPFSESAETDETVDVKHIENDRVEENNLMILREIVSLADRGTHKCPYSDLKANLSDIMGEKNFKSVFDTLISRGVIVRDSNNNVSIFIDLFYEIDYRITHKKI